MRFYEIADFMFYDINCGLNQNKVRSNNILVSELSIKVFNQQLRVFCFL